MSYKDDLNRQKTLDKCIEVDVGIDVVREYAGKNNKQHTHRFVQGVIKDIKKSLMSIEKMVEEIK